MIRWRPLTSGSHLMSQRISYHVGRNRLQNRYGSRFATVLGVRRRVIPGFAVEGDKLDLFPPWLSQSMGLLRLRPLGGAWASKSRRRPSNPASFSSSPILLSFQPLLFFFLPLRLRFDSHPSAECRPHTEDRKGIASTIPRSHSFPP